MATGIYCGSFDPPTLGHVELMERALGLVDRLVVAVGRNADKAGWLPVEERVVLLEAVAPRAATVRVFDGLAVDAAREAGARLLVRGLRSGRDLDGEMAMARCNAELAPELETVVLLASPRVAHVSSRLVREVHRGGGDLLPFVPPAVAEHLARRGAPR